MTKPLFQWRSLKTRVTLFTLAIFLISIWSLAFYVSHRLRDDMQRLLGKQQFATVSFRALEMSRELADRLSALGRLASMLDPAMLATPTALADFLDTRTVLQIQFNGGVTVFAVYGTALAEVPPPAGRLGVNYMGTDSVAGALNAGKSTISRPAIDRNLQAPVFDITVPIRDAGGAVIGALSGLTNLSQPNFLDQISESYYGKTGYYLLIEPKSRLIITGTGRSRILQPLPPSGVNPLFDHFIQGYEDTGVTFDTSDTEILASSRRVDGTDWFIVAALPTDEAFGLIQVMRQYMLQAALLLTLLAGGLTWWMIRRELSPMLAAVKTLAALSDSEQSPQPLPISRQNEIGKLIGGFNHLLETLRKREGALKESELRFRNLFFKNALVMLIIEPSAGQILDANKAAATYYGYPLEELIGMFTDSINTLSLEKLAEERQKAVHGQCNSFLFAHRLASGELRDVEVSSTPIESGGNLLLFSIVTDITVRKRAELELRIAATAFESREGMMITDAKGVILRVNRAFTEITGYSAAEAIGQTPRLLQSGCYDVDFYREMWETIQRTGGWQGEMLDRHKSGEEYPKWLTVSAVRDEDGRITNFIGTHYDISERKSAEQKIEALAFFDQLTGLPNRTLLLDRLKQAMTASGRIGSYGALLFIDLDNFKTLNDTQGHDVGDMLLKQAAQRLKLCVREGDTVARLGGDEFVIILTGLSANQAEAATDSEAVTEKILNTLQQSYQLGAIAYRCTASIGVTLFMDNLSSIDDLMKQADLAMYKSKAAGRNSLSFFDPAMEIALRKRAALEDDLRQALEARQFVLHYQAQVVGAGRLTGAEVLIRWQHPVHGMVSPADFIPLAEETGLILPLGHWVLETACTQLALWALRPEMASLTVSVNVSVHQFRQHDFVDKVLAVLRDTGADPYRLKLEITESLLVRDVEEIVEKMFALKGKGVGFSLDDFGTGYSSLTYLKRLPLDQLKIDQSFVRDVLVDPNDAAIAKTIVALAHSLGLGVIAEGVESAAQRDFLATAGCHAYQGYFFGRPLALDDFEKFALRV